MPKNRPPVILTRDGSRTLLNPEGESFKSRHGALGEARLVYLEGSGVAARLARGELARVLEVGFGAGLNFLVTATAAVAAAAQAGQARLDYLALERQLPSADVMAELRYSELLAPSAWPGDLLAWRAGLGERPAAGWHALERGPVRLRLFVGDALADDWEPEVGPSVDAVYHDAFGPAGAPALWTPQFLARLGGRLAPGAALVSFCVAGHVRRSLAAAGLQVSKTAGPESGKREVLVARRPAAT